MSSESTTANVTRRSRSIELDCLRGVAILLVGFRHPVLAADQAGFLTVPATSLFNFGWAGVDLFFVLSGFLIGGLLFQELKIRGSLDIPRFYIRRGFKIWPAYFAFLAATFARIHWHDHYPALVVLRWMTPNLLQIQNYHEGVAIHTWSIAVEEHFYLILPAVLWLATRRGDLRKSGLLIVGFLLGAMIVCNAIRMTKVLAHPILGTHIHFDALAFGVLLAYVFHLKPQRLAWVASHRWQCFLVGLVLVSPRLFTDTGPDFTLRYYYTLLYLGFGMILLSLVCKPSVPSSRPLALPWRALAAVGFFSYSIYLWTPDFVRQPLEHWLVPRLPSSMPTLRWVIAEIAHLVCAFAVGAVTAKLIELPALAIRDRMFPSRARAIAVTHVTAPSGVDESLVAPLLAQP